MTANTCIFKVCYAIANNLGPKFMFLPRNKDEMREKAAEFEAKFGMPKPFGCIDGTHHIRIRRPIRNSQEYFNYKHFFTLNVQAVCDFQGDFMDIDSGWPGSVHDAKVQFVNSSLNKKLSNGLPVTYKQLLPGHAQIPNSLIASVLHERVSNMHNKPRSYIQQFVVNR